MGIATCTFNAKYNLVKTLGVEARVFRPLTSMGLKIPNFVSVDYSDFFTLFCEEPGFETWMVF